MEHEQLSDKRHQTNLPVTELLRTTEDFILDCVTQSESCRIDELIRYHLESGGARVRARLALTAGLAIGLPERTCVALAACCELVHNASLLHDDIQDKDTQRRGRDAAWFKFDVNTAMCAGTLMLSASFSALARCETNTGLLVSHLHRRTATLIHGQVLDLAGSSSIPDDEAYVKMAASKSGSLLALPLELVFIAGQRIDLLPTARTACESFAIAYQIADDLLDLAGDLQRGNANVVCVYQQMGLNQKQAIQQSNILQMKHLKLARQNALHLPAGSGALLLQLCGSIENSRSPESNKLSECL